MQWGGRGGLLELLFGAAQEGRAAEGRAAEGGQWNTTKIGCLPFSCQMGYPIINPSYLKGEHWNMMRTGLLIGPRERPEAEGDDTWYTHGTGGGSECQLSPEKPVQTLKERVRGWGRGGGRRGSVGAGAEAGD